MPSTPVEASKQYASVPSGQALMNVIRANASSTYQERIPEATTDNLREIGTRLFEYQSSMNEFLTALVNRIGRVLITNRMYNNPLKELKGGMLSLGETTEEIFVNLIKAQTYDPRRAETNLYKRNIPDVRTAFHTLNDQRQYKFTISNDQLRTAFLSYEGIENLIAKIVDSAYASDNYDEFIITKRMIQEAVTGGFVGVATIGDVTDQTTAKSAMVSLRALSNNLTFMSEGYNYAGVSTTTPKEDQIILIRTDFDALVDVEVLAYAFNMSKADYLARRILIDDFGMDDVVAFICDREWFKIYDNFLSFTEVYNAEGLYWNYFLNHWETFSYSPFCNAIAITTGGTSITSVTVSPATANVNKGDGQHMVATVVGTGVYNGAVRWTISGNKSDYTTINYDGLLMVDKDEPSGTEITVTATSVQDTTKVGTATITVA